MRSGIRPAAWAVAAVGLVGLAGCGQSVGRPTGKITAKGAPVAAADIKFVAADDPTKEFFGRSGDDGTYAVSYREYAGVPVGRYKVTVTAHTLRNGKPLPGGEAGEALKGDEARTVRRAYAFDKEITSGANAIDFELAEGQPAAPE